MCFVADADRHLLHVNYLVEPYRLPQKAAAPDTAGPVNPDRQSPHGPGNAVLRGITWPDRAKNLERFPDNAEIDLVAAKEAENDRQFVRIGETQPDAYYDENTEVELDKDDVKLARLGKSDVGGISRAVPEARDGVVVDTGEVRGGLPGRKNAGADAGAVVGPGRMTRSRSDGGAVRVLFRLHWFPLVFLFCLLMFAFRCVRCFRCCSLLRRCRSI